MSISYDANIICDVCREHTVSGETETNARDALRSAIETAEKHHFIWKERWLCPECQKRLSEESFTSDANKP